MENKAQNKGMKSDLNHLKELATKEIESILLELPEPLRKQAQKLPVTLEWAPNRDLQTDGIDAQSLGLFIGAEFAAEGETVMPSQIMVFIGNLWDFAGKEEEKFRDEILSTFLHELGHFFGLDEDDLAERGLE